MDNHANFAYSTVATAPSPATSGTSLVVAAGEGALFPTPPFNATIWPASAQPLSTTAEIVRVTGVSTDTLTIVRAQEGSSARTVVVGDQIANTVTKKTLTDTEVRDAFVCWLGHPLGAVGTGVGAMTAASRAQGHRVIVPKSGTLNELNIYVGTSSGNIEVGIMDTTVTTRNQLWTSGSIACPAANGWRKIGDPGIAVSEGDHIDFYVNADNTTATFGRITGIATATAAAFPTGTVVSPLGGKPTLVWQGPAATFPLGTTLAETSMGFSSLAPGVIAQIT